MRKETIKNVTLRRTVFYEIVEHYQHVCSGEVRYLSQLIVQVDWAKVDLVYMPDGASVYYTMSRDGLQVYASYEDLHEDLPNYCIDDPFAAYEVNFHNGIFTVSYLCGL